MIAPRAPYVHAPVPPLPGATMSAGELLTLHPSAPSAHFARKTKDVSFGTTAPELKGLPQPVEKLADRAFALGTNVPQGNCPAAPFSFPPGDGLATTENAGKVNLAALETYPVGQTRVGRSLLVLNLGAECTLVRNLNLLPQTFRVGCGMILGWSPLV